MLDRCPQGKQAIDGRFLHRYHALYCLALQHIPFRRFCPHFLGLALFRLAYSRELVRSRYFPWPERFVSHAVRSGPRLSTYVIIARTQTGKTDALLVAANSKAEDETMPWDFASNTEKAWRAYDVLPDPSDGHQGQPQLHAMNLPGSGTANWYIDGYRM